MFAYITILRVKLEGWISNYRKIIKYKKWINKIYINNYYHFSFVDTYLVPPSTTVTCCLFLRLHLLICKVSFNILEKIASSSVLGSFSSFSFESFHWIYTTFTDACLCFVDLCLGHVVFGLSCNILFMSSVHFFHFRSHASFHFCFVDLCSCRCWIGGNLWSIAVFFHLFVWGVGRLG